MTDIQQTITENMKSMPLELKEAIDHIDIDQQFGMLTEKFGFHADMMNRLYVLVWTILLGIDDTEKFNKRIEEDLNLGPNIALSVAKSVEESIFQPIRTYMMKNTENETKEEVEETKPVIPKNVKVNVEKEKEEKPQTPPIPPQTKEVQPAPTQAPTPPKQPSTPPVPSRTEEPTRTIRKEGGEGVENKYGAHDPYREPVDNDEE